MNKPRLLVLSLLLAAVGTVMAFFWDDWRVQWKLTDACRALRQRDPDRALTVLREAAAIDSANGEVFFYMARVFRRRGELDLVHHNLSKAHQLGFSAPRIRREEWLAMAQAGQMREAEPYLAELLVNPGDDGPEICEAYANGYFLAYRFADANRVLDAWQKDFPNDPGPHLFRGLLAKKNLAWSVAAEHFQKAYSLAPERVDAQLQLANAWLSLRKTAAATELFRQLLKVQPDNVEVRIGWGRVQLEGGKMDEAQRIFAAILNDDPQNYDARVALGQLELNANRAGEAVCHLQLAFAADASDSECRFALANALQRAGRNDEARKHFQFVAEQQEVSARLQHLLERVTHKADDLSARYEIVELLREHGQPAERAAWLRSIVDLDPNQSRAHVLLAEHYDATSQTELAEKHRRLAEMIGGSNFPVIKEINKKGQDHGPAPRNLDDPIAD